MSSGVLGPNHGVMLSPRANLQNLGVRQRSQGSPRCFVLQHDTGTVFRDWPRLAATGRDWPRPGTRDEIPRNDTVLRVMALRMARSLSNRSQVEIVASASTQTASR